MFIFNFIVNKGGEEEESNRVLEHRDYVRAWPHIDIHAHGMRILVDHLSSVVAMTEESQISANFPLNLLTSI